MAQQVNVKFVDDLDGSDATGTVSFALDGRAYEIDLSEDNAARLRDSLASFVGAARKSGRTGARSPTAAGSRRPCWTPSRPLTDPDEQGEGVGAFAPAPSSVIARCESRGRDRLGSLS